MGIKNGYSRAETLFGRNKQDTCKVCGRCYAHCERGRKSICPKNAKTVVTGLPVRGAFNTMSKSEAKKQLGFDENEICVLSTGGSLGARVLNENIAKLLKWYQDNDVKVCHIHSYGTYQGYKDYPESWRLWV